MITFVRLFSVQQRPGHCNPSNSSSLHNQQTLLAHKWRTTPYTGYICRTIRYLIVPCLLRLLKPTAKAMSDNKGLVVVTGSTAGIGKAIARAFVQQGRIVVVNGRKQNTVDALVQELTSTITSDGPTSDHLKPKVLGVAGDLGTAEGANKFIADVDALASADGLVVDVLINNMGIFESSPFFETPDSEWHRYIDTNFFSSLILSRHWLKGMLQRKQGRIIMLSSGAGEMIVAEMLHYSITKQMQIGLARGLAQLTKGTEVTVNSVLPGPVWTEGVDSMLKVWLCRHAAGKLVQCWSFGILSADSLASEM
eukprot:GHRR01024545.1.p1 GENE.GHRR01024545.1~~GHRR01024545.1.p1  ORF type:complete len:309 (+),score=46.60 GHRR01024545.1:226-1152(+)